MKTSFLEDVQFRIYYVQSFTKIGLLGLVQFGVGRKCYENKIEFRGVKKKGTKNGLKSC